MIEPKYVVCGGHDQVGLYIGELVKRDPYAHQLVRIVWCLEYPGQYTLLAHELFPRYPLPWGAVVRLGVVQACAAPPTGDYLDSVYAAHARALAAAEDSAVLRSCLAERDPCECRLPRSLITH